jgi:hypothetical protein
MHPTGEQGNSSFDTPPLEKREMLGLRMRQPAALAPEGPAQPHRREERPKRLRLRTCHPTRSSSRVRVGNGNGMGDASPAGDRAIHPPRESRGMSGPFSVKNLNVS